MHHIDEAVKDTDTTYRWSKRKRITSNWNKAENKREMEE
jgi:hypothetical protein